jgi:tRNA (guanine37-N1)-methyltransferase
MNQKNLEEKVRDLFEEQGFEVTEKEGYMMAQNGQELVLKVFSSEEFSADKVVERVSTGEKVFVDQGLEGIEERVESQVSVIREKEDREDYDLPSYELIGQIAVINEMTVNEEEAIEGILQNHPSVETILLKEEPLQGEFRVGGYRRLYGDETETTHKEYGCRFKVDPTKAYYSERFSTERKRVVDQIEDGEKVLVMFAGVGPFAIMAAKLANPEKVVAVEKNPAAAEYLKENIKLNKVEDTVEGYEGDVREVVPSLEEKFDRVIMPLPEKAAEFLPAALDMVADEDVIHYYRFLENGRWSSLEGEVEEVLDEIELKYEVVGREKCGDRGPDVDRVCMDIRIFR